MVVRRDDVDIYARHPQECLPLEAGRVETGPGVEGVGVAGEDIQARTAASVGIRGSERKRLGRVLSQREMGEEASDGRRDGEEAGATGGGAVVVGVIGGCGRHGEVMGVGTRWVFGRNVREEAGRGFAEPEKRR